MMDSMKLTAVFVSVEILAIAVSSGEPPQIPTAAYSELWGKTGENWSPESRLPDFSRTGYHRGEGLPPVIARGVSVRDFGAIGDGKTNDTAAFTKALATVKNGVIEVPAGRYLITKPLVITKSGVVLKGAGPDKSVLFFPTPLNDIVPDWGATTTNTRTSNYSWSGGFVAIRGSFRSKKITEITASAKRGAKVLAVTSAEHLKIGQEVELYQHDLPDNSLAVALYSGDSGPVSKIRGTAHSSLIARITGIRDGKIAIDRPLRCDVEPRWNPQLRVFDPSVTESGVESLGFEFPLTAYRGHFTELGFNPLTITGAAHCWLRNIHVLNADSGPFVGGVFNLIDGIVLESKRPEDKQHCTGHHGISLGGGDNLLTHFEIRTRFIHDITMDAFASGNVVMCGRGVDLCLDHHRRAPYENLFTELDAGAGTRLWKCGGGEALGKHCAARGTFWNIRAAKPLKYPPADFGPPSMNFVALTSDLSPATKKDGKWFESISPSEIRPQNLYEAQKANLNRQNATKKPQ